MGTPKNFFEIYTVWARALKKVRQPYPTLRQSLVSMLIRVHAGRQGNKNSRQAQEIFIVSSIHTGCTAQTGFCPMSKGGALPDSKAAGA